MGVRPPSRLAQARCTRWVLYGVPDTSLGGDAGATSTRLLDRQSGTSQQVGPNGSYDGRLSAATTSTKLLPGDGVDPEMSENGKFVAARQGPYAMKTDLYDVAAGTHATYGPVSFVSVSPSNDGRYLTLSNEYLAQTSTRYP